MLIDNSLSSIADLIRDHKETLLARWRNKVRTLPAAHHLEKVTLNDHIPTLLQELATAFEQGIEHQLPSQIAKGSSPIHGTQRLASGFKIEEVVAEYNILRNCIHDMAAEHGINLARPSIQILNTVIDTAIGAALNAYTVQQAQQVQHEREDYLAFVTHDLRTPLAAITLAAQIVENETKSQVLSARADKAIGTMHRNLAYLTGLVNKILEENANVDTGQGVALERRKFELWPLVESLLQDMHPIASAANVTVVNAIPEDLVVFADAALIRRVFQNLIANAVRHTLHGEVRIAAVDMAHQQQIACAVADNGAGIPADRLPYIFDKFETDSLQSTDFGLGLTICKAFIEVHGGSITVESSPDQGACFTFTLPDRSSDT